MNLAQKCSASLQRRSWLRRPGWTGLEWCRCAAKGRAVKVVKWVLRRRVLRDEEVGEVVRGATLVDEADQEGVDVEVVPVLRGQVAGPADRYRRRGLDTRFVPRSKWSLSAAWAAAVETRARTTSEDSADESIGPGQKRFWLGQDFTIGFIVPATMQRVACSCVSVERPS